MAARPGDPDGGALHGRQRHRYRRPRCSARSSGRRSGTSIVVDNRAGAGGTLGAALVAKAPPDGYTLLVHSAGHLVNPAIYPNLSYDTLKDFAGVTPLASLPNVLVTAPGRFKDVRDLVEQAKSKPGTLNYGSAGNGSATHMNAEVFRFAAGLQAQHVPFKRHARGPERGDGRPHRLVLRADGLGPVAGAETAS